jgi:hypothetical protein
MIQHLPEDLRDRILEVTDLESRAQLRLVSHALKLAVDRRTQSLRWTGGKMLVRDVRGAARCTAALNISVRGGGKRARHDGEPGGGGGAATGCKNKISRSVLGALSTLRMPHLTWIDLSGNTARAGTLDAGMEVFARGDWPLLAALDLSGCGLTGEGARHLAGGAWPRLRALALSDNPLGPDGVGWIAQVSTSLRGLVLDGCRLGDRGAAALAAAAAGVPNVKRLHLSRNDITATGLVALAGSSWKQLAHLEFNTNFLGHDAAPTTCPWPLRALTLDYTHVGTFATMVAAMPATLTRLSLKNAMTYDPDDPPSPAAAKIAAGLDTLDLSFNSSRVMRHVLVGREWPRLRALTLGDLDDETMLELFMGDTRFPALETLDARSSPNNELALGTWMVLLEDSEARFPKLRLFFGTSKYPQTRTQLVPRFNASREVQTVFKWTV